MPDKKTQNPAHRAPDDGSGGAGDNAQTKETSQSTANRLRPGSGGLDHRARFFNSNDPEAATGYDPVWGW